MKEVSRKFKIGDAVKLKSGSPVMTVSDLDLKKDPNQSSRIDADMFVGTLECKWFVDTQLKYEIFHQDTLELITV